jgi:hypothetical protein
MSNTKWDLKFSELNQNITMLEQKVLSALPKEKVTLIQKKNHILGYQSALLKLVEQFNRINKKCLHIGDKPRAVIHWGQVIADRMMKLYERRSAIWCATMWQKLIKERLIGNTSNQNLFIDDQDIIAMATRFNYLKQVESQLTAELVRLQHKKEDFVEQNKILATKISNRLAAQSLQGPEGHYKSGPGKHISALLKDYINWLTLPLRGHTPVEVKFQKEYQEAITRTKEVLASCREIIDSDTAFTGSGEQHARVRDVRENLVKVDELHTRLEHSIHQVFKSAPPAIKPTIIPSKPTQHLNP